MLDVEKVRLVASMPLLFRPRRLLYWFEQIRSLAELGAEKVHLHIITNTDAMADLRCISDLLYPLASAKFTYDITTYWDAQDPKAMTWQHKKIFDQLYLKDDNYTHFLYLEDDLRFTVANLKYWLRYRDMLRPAGLIPSFIRYEFRSADCGLYLSDCVRPSDTARGAIRLEGETFIMPDNPYCAMYILDRDLWLEYRSSASFDPELSKQRIGWPATERSAMGLAFEAVPAGRISRNVVPLDLSKGVPVYECFIHHLPNNFTNGETVMTKFQFGSILIKNGFISEANQEFRA